MYGKLEYFLAFTTAGPMIEFFAIVFLPNVNEEQGYLLVLRFSITNCYYRQRQIKVCPLNLQFDISTAQRADAYLVLINVCRWIRSVVAAGI